MIDEDGARPSADRLARRRNDRSAKADRTSCQWRTHDAGDQGRDVEADAMTFAKGVGDITASLYAVRATLLRRSGIVG